MPIMPPSDNEHIQTGERLITEMLSNPDHASGSKLNDLLSCFFAGLPIKLLGPLLQHSSKKIITGALFIAEELGEVAAPLFDEIKLHVHNEDPEVRYAALNAIESCADEMHREDAFAHFVQALQDPDQHCRKIAVLCLMRTEGNQLGAPQKDSDVVDAEQEVRIILNRISDDGLQIKSWMASQDSSRRLLGLIAAARAADCYLKLIELATKSDDSDLQTFARACNNFLLLRRRKYYEELRLTLRKTPAC